MSSHQIHNRKVMSPASPSSGDYCKKHKATGRPSPRLSNVQYLPHSHISGPRETNTCEDMSLPLSPQGYGMHNKCCQSNAHPSKFQSGEIVFTGEVRQRLLCEANKTIEGKQRLNKPCGFIPLLPFWINTGPLFLANLFCEVYHIFKLLMRTVGSSKKNMHAVMPAADLCNAR